MSYYLNKLYYWWYIDEPRPWRPTMEDYKRKNMMIKQIKDTKQFKFKNREQIPNPLNCEIKKSESIEKDELTQQIKIEMLNKIKEFKSRKQKNKSNINNNGENSGSLCPSL